MANLPSRRSRRQQAAVNITPLVDVLLVLVIVLMLAMPLFVKRLPVNMPKTSLAGVPAPMVSLSLALQPGGGLFLNGKPEILENVLPKVTDQTTVEMSIDKNTRYETMAEVIAQVQAKSPKEIILLTR
jgi:biopolymer transport protein ExbD